MSAILPHRFSQSLLYLQLFFLLTTIITLTQANLNCHGSARCYGHHGRENDIITYVNNDMPTWSTFSNKKTVACVSTGSNGLRGGGDWGFCAMLQNIGSASFGRTEILAMLNDLKNVGKCNPCGSIPTGWPADNSTGGELTINFVHSIPCVGYCSNEANNPSNRITLGDGKVANHGNEALYEFDLTGIYPKTMIEILRESQISNLHFSS